MKRTIVPATNLYNQIILTHALNGSTARPDNQSARHYGRMGIRGVSTAPIGATRAYPKHLIVDPHPLLYNRLQALTSESKRIKTGYHLVCCSYLYC